MSYALKCREPEQIARTTNVVPLRSREVGSVRAIPAVPVKSTGVPNDDRLIGPLREAFGVSNALLNRERSTTLSRTPVPPALPVRAGVAAPSISLPPEYEAIPRFLAARRSPEISQPRDSSSADALRAALSETISVSGKKSTQAARALRSFCSKQQLQIFGVAGMLAGALLVAFAVPLAGSESGHLAHASNFLHPSSGGKPDDTVVADPEPSLTALALYDRTGLAALLDATAETPADNRDDDTQTASRLSALSMTASEVLKSIDRRSFVPLPVADTSRALPQREPQIASAHLASLRSMQNGEAASRSMLGKPPVAPKVRSAKTTNSAKMPRRETRAAPAAKPNKKAHTIAVRKIASPSWPTPLVAPTNLHEAVVYVWKGR